MGILAQPGLTSRPLFGSLAGGHPHFWEPHVPAKSSSHGFLDNCCARQALGRVLGTSQPGTSQLSVMIISLMAFSKKTKQNKTKRHRVTSVQEVVPGECTVDPARSYWGHNAEVTRFAASQHPRGCLNWEEEHFSLLLALL